MIPLRDVPGWWWREMQMLAASATGHDETSDRSDAFVIAVDDATTTLYRRERGQETAVGPLPLDPSALLIWRRARRGQEKWPVIIRQPSLRWLERDVALPLAAEHDIGSTLRYMMPELTPFEPGDIAWTWRITRRDTAQGKIWLQLMILPIATLRQLSGFLSQNGMDHLQYQVTSPDGDLRLFQPYHASGRARQGLVMVAALLVLAGIAIVTPFILQGIAIARTEARIQQLEPGALEASALAHRLNPTGRGPGDIISRRSVLSVLAALTETLPDDSWLSALSFHGGTIELTGEAADSATLIADLSKNSLFKNPAYTAPVTRAVNGRGDQFSIQTHIAP